MERERDYLDSGYYLDMGASEGFKASLNLNKDVIDYYDLIQNTSYYSNTGANKGQLASSNPTIDYGEEVRVKAMTLAQTQLIKDNYIETDTSESNEASSNLNKNFANIGASEGNDASLNPNENMMHTCSLKSLTVHWPRTCQNSKPLDNKRVEMPRLGCHDYLI